MARPKNRTTILLEREIRKLEARIQELEAELAKRPVSSVSGEEVQEELNERGYLFFLKVKGGIDIQTLHVNTEKEIVKFGERKALADGLPRALFELEKLIAHKELFNKEVK